MNFFESQSNAQRESLQLLAAFFLIIIACFVVIYWIANILAYPISAIFSSLNPDVVRWGFFGTLTAFMGFGCYRRWLELSKGGHLLAERMGAIPATLDSEEFSHKQLRNMVEEMAVAASVKPPQSYVITEENSINAFVAGNKESTVLVVTQGTLDHLNADEIRAVVAHETAHIANNDLAISMKLLIALGGLNAISEAARFSYFNSEIFSSTRRFYRPNRILIPKSTINSLGIFTIFIPLLIIALAATLFLLGCAFSLLGQFLKAAFSRQRELMADAKAVQFTRDPWSLASALNKIANSDMPRGLHTRYAADVAHVCIDAPPKRALAISLFATHPPMQTRITSIEPHFRVKHRKKTNTDKSNYDKPATGAARTIVKPDESVLQTIRPVNDFAPELSILFSLIIQTSGYNTKNNIKKYESTIKSYVNNPPPMRHSDEPGINDKFELALDTLLQMPAVQRQHLLDHIAELVDHDGIQEEEEKQMLNLIYKRLNPSDNAA